MSLTQRLEIVRLRNELAFLVGDQAIGGGNHDREIEELRVQIRALSNAPADPPSRLGKLGVRS